MQVFLTEQHLAIALEYATDGELFDRVKQANRFDEDMARFFFQQLIAGASCMPFRSRCTGEGMRSPDSHHMPRASPCIKATCCRRPSYTRTRYDQTCSSFLFPTGNPSEIPLVSPGFVTKKMHPFLRDPGLAVQSLSCRSALAPHRDPPVA